HDHADDQRLSEIPREPHDYLRSMEDIGGRDVRPQSIHSPDSQPPPFVPVVNHAAALGVYHLLNSVMIHRSNPGSLPWQLPTPVLVVITHDLRVRSGKQTRCSPVQPFVDDLIDLRCPARTKDEQMERGIIEARHGPIGLARAEEVTPEGTSRCRLVTVT